MSLVLLSAIGTGALWYAARSEQLAAQQSDKERVSEVAPRFMPTGTYGDTQDLSNILGQQGMIVGEQADVDLQGVPCRWLYMRNGACYRVYDMKTNFVGQH